MLGSASLDPARFVATPAPGRHCGTCTLCCKVYDVPSLEKPAGKWCSHCKPGTGCGIWETRPDHCRAFHCLYMTEGWLGEEWKPERAKFVLTLDPATRFLLAQVDPGQARAWKAEPYYTQFKRWAAAAIREERLVIVFINKSATVVLPDRDLDVGVMEANDRLFLETRMTPNGPTVDISKRKVS
jgi:Fe-S-cluster containining protein